MATFFTSDTHYGHKNICLATSQWPDKSRCRDYSSLGAMNDAIVASINGRVSAGDTLYHLGDWSFGGLDNVGLFRSRINCANVHLVLGNHDHHMDKSEVKRLFSSVSPYLETCVEGQEMVLFHYALRVWNRQGQGAWHLYGHSHGLLSRKMNRSIDVGMDGDSYLGVRPPWSMEELAEVFKNDTLLPEDHHNQHSQTPPLGGRKRAMIDNYGRTQYE